MSRNSYQPVLHVIDTTKVCTGGGERNEQDRSSATVPDVPGEMQQKDKVIVNVQAR